MADTIAQELTAFCEKSMREDRVHSYSFASTAYVTAYDHATPPMWGKTRQADVYSQVEMGWDAHLLADYQLGAAYADNNPLLLGEAADIAQAQITALFPGDALYLMNAAVFDRTFYKATGKPISEKGYYHLEFHQVFIGISLYGKRAIARLASRRLAMRITGWKNGAAPRRMFSTRMRFCWRAGSIRKPACCNRISRCCPLTA